METYQIAIIVLVIANIGVVRALLTAKEFPYDHEH